MDAIPPAARCGRMVSDLIEQHIDQEQLAATSDRGGSGASYPQRHRGTVKR